MTRRPHYDARLQWDLVRMSARYRFGRYVLDANARVLTARGEPLDVGARAFDTLLVLVQRAPGVVTKAELLETVWRGLIIGTISKSR